MTTHSPIELQDVNKHDTATKNFNKRENNVTEDGNNSALNLEDGYNSQGATGKIDFNAMASTSQVVPVDQPRLIDPRKIRNSVFIEKPPPKKCNKRVTCIVALLVILVVLIVGYIVAYLVMSSLDEEEVVIPWEPKITGVIEFG